MDLPSEKTPAKPSTAQPERRVRVMVVDDHHVVRAGLQAVLSESPELEVVGEAGTATEALALCERFHPDVLLLDLHLPDRSGVEVCREVKLICATTKVLFLTSYGDEANVLAGLAAGADGYLLKTITGGDIADAVLKVAAGGAVLDPLVTRHLLGHLSFSPDSQTPASHLTPKEHSILEQIAAGQLNKEIASTLGLSEKTVRNQLTAIYNKLGVKTRAEAAILHQRMRSAGQSPVR
jgi:two-component system, NarL family, response regulator DevR